MSPCALVTGGAQRLGEAIVRHLASKGYNVVLHYNTNRERAAAIAAECTSRFGVKVVPLHADLREENEILSLFHRARECLDGHEISVLVNNASLFEPDSVLTATMESWDRSIKTNLQAPFFLTQSFARQWLVPDERGGHVTALMPGLEHFRDDNKETLARGVVVNMIDQRVHKLTPQFATYTLGKVGLWEITQTTAQALAPVVRVNGIGPGPTLCGARQAPDEFAEQRRLMPLERGPNVDDVLAALSYLIDAKAVTGQLISVDGGQHLAWQTRDTFIKE
jgi:NAD(P)-dependent dehydrogenase (short-subunit alcohol dehydrogenase family)